MGNDPVSAAPSCFLVKFAGIKPDREDFIQTRTVAYNRSFGILRPSVYLWATKLQVIGFEDHALVLSLGHNKHVTVLRPLIAAGLIVFRTGRFARQTRVGRKSGEKKRASRVVRTLHTFELCDGVVSRERSYITHTERRERQKKETTKEFAGSEPSAFLCSSSFRPKRTSSQNPVAHPQLENNVPHGGAVLVFAIKK